MLKNQKGASDLPVVLVAVGSGLIVMILVALFLVVLPNRDVLKVLVQYEDSLKRTLIETRELVDHLPKYRQELKDIEKDSNILEEELVLDKESLKKEIQEAFAKGSFAFDDYHLGASYAGSDEWWKALPLDFTVHGSAANLLPVIETWRGQAPATIRLLEVDIRKADEGETENSEDIFAVFLMTASSLIPREEIDRKPTKPFDSFEIPEAGIFETNGVRAKRNAIKKFEKEILSYRDLTQELGTLREDRSRLLSVLARKANFKAEHEREFDLLENQLRSILKKLDKETTHRIIIKVEETDVE